MRVKRRVAELNQSELSCQEPLQVTYYNTTEFFAPHRDALSEGGVELGSSGDRTSTVIIYLNDDYTGGKTRFHKIGVTVKPERGKAVYFKNLTDDESAPHPLSLHGAGAVASGEKWILNQWTQQRPFSKGNRSSRRAKARKQKRTG